MVLKVTCTLDEVDFSTLTHHPGNVIMVSFEGPGAAKTPLNHLHDFLIRIAADSDIELDVASLDQHYRGEEACRVYFPLPDFVDTTKLHGRALKKDRILFRAIIPGREPQKIFLSFLPPTITDDGIRKLTSSFIQPDKVHSHHRHINGRLDRHLLIAEIDDLDQVPHFIELTDKRTYKITRIAITMPGRLPLCAVCGKSGHYASQCPTRPSPNQTESATTTTETIAEPPKTERGTEKRPHQESSSISLKSTPELTIDLTPTEPESKPEKKRVKKSTPLFLQRFKKSESEFNAEEEEHRKIEKEAKVRIEVNSKMILKILGTDETIRAAMVLLDEYNKKYNRNWTEEELLCNRLLERKSMSSQEPSDVLRR